MCVCVWRGGGEEGKWAHNNTIITHTYPHCVTLVGVNDSPHHHHHSITQQQQVRNHTVVMLPVPGCPLHTSLPIRA